MPKKIKPLTFREVQILHHTSALGGIPGFCLKVQGANRRSYILRLPVGNGKYTEIGLGGINQITYDEARKRAAEIYQRLVGELSPTVIERKVSALEKLQISKELRSRVQGEAVEKNEKNFAVIGSKFATLEQLFYGWIEVQKKHNMQIFFAPSMMKH